METVKARHPQRSEQGLGDQPGLMKHAAKAGDSEKPLSTQLKGLGEGMS